MRQNDLTETLSGFEAARGEKYDRVWADVAALALLQADVAPAVIRQILAEARQWVEDSQEPPEQLFGPAREWAADQIAERRSAGLPVSSPDPQTSWRDVPAIGFIGAALFALTFMVVALVKGRSSMDYTLGYVAFPVVAGLGTMAAFTTWEKVLARRPVWVAALSGLGVLAVVVATLATLILTTNDHPFAQASPWRMGLLALACIIAATVFDRVLPEPLPRRSSGPLDDDEWTSVAAGALRLRADMPESRVRTLLDEARAHAAESGTSLQAEFGRPEDYASRFAPDARTAAFRKAWVWSAVCALGAVLAFAGEFSWSGLFICLTSGSLALGQWFTVRRLR